MLMINDDDPGEVSLSHINIIYAIVSLKIPGEGGMLSAARN